MTEEVADYALPAPILSGSEGGMASAATCAPQGKGEEVALSEFIPHSAAAGFGTAQTGQVRMTEQAVGDAELEDQMLVCDSRP